MDLDMTWEDLARATGGKIIVGGLRERLGSISTDTRSLNQGQIFWALGGPRYDPHEFLDQTMADRASGWVVAAGKSAALSARPRQLMEVPDTLTALQALAARHRKRFDLPLVAITGSNGKTTTKEMLRGIFGLVGPTCATTGNLNNHIGLPLSLLELGSKHRYGVFELAASHAGEISLLSRIALPTVAVLTNIGPAHIEFFGTLEKTFAAKVEILEHLSNDGSAIINADDPFLSPLEAVLGSRCVTFGLSSRARVRFEDSSTLLIDRHRVAVKLRSFGAITLLNAAAAAAAAWSLGINPETIRQGLEAYSPSALRLEPRPGPAGSQIIIDAYNANPASMSASIEAFCSEFSGRRLVLVLGDMRELGEHSARYHQELGQSLARLPLAAVYLAGIEMKPAADALALNKPGFPFHYSAAPEAWIDSLRGELREGTAALFKASRALKFESLLDKF